MKYVQYTECGACHWYGPTDDLLESRVSEPAEFWGARVTRTYVETVCPECGKDDALNDAGGPCIRCEAAPAITGSDYCQPCDAFMQEATPDSI